MRYPTYDPAPFIPGIDRQRFEWLPEDDPDIARLHAGVQEAGRGLYLVWDPVRKMRVLIEAYEPWELPVHYRAPVTKFVDGENGRPERMTLSKMLNPFQYADLKAGRLVCINEVEAFNGPLPDALIQRVREGNRAAREHYKYGVTPASYREAEIRHRVVDVRREESKKIIRQASERVADYFAHGLVPNHVVPDTTPM